MLCIHNPSDIAQMKKYYRTRDMIHLLELFPEVSPICDLTIVESIEDFLAHEEYLRTLDHNRVDSLVGKKILNIENAGHSSAFLDTLQKIKEQDKQGVLVLFRVNALPSERYERYAGISIGVDVGKCVFIDAVGKGFDGREVSKGICVHERYMIPWFDLRKCCIANFKTYQTFLIPQEEYAATRKERISFLKSVGLDATQFCSYLPEKYEPIPDFIWKDVLERIIKPLEKKEDFLLSEGFTTFAISGHTEGKKFCPWQMFDRSRFYS